MPSGACAAVLAAYWASSSRNRHQSGCGQPCVNIGDCGPGGCTQCRAWATPGDLYCGQACGQNCSESAQCADPSCSVCAGGTCRSGPHTCGAHCTLDEHCTNASQPECQNCIRGRCGSGCGAACTSDAQCADLTCPVCEVRQGHCARAKLAAFAFAAPEEQDRVSPVIPLALVVAARTSHSDTAGFSFQVLWTTVCDNMSPRRIQRNCTISHSAGGCNLTVGADYVYGCRNGRLGFSAQAMSYDGAHLSAVTRLEVTVADLWVEYTYVITGAVSMLASLAVLLTVVRIPSARSWPGEICLWRSAAHLVLAVVLLAVNAQILRHRLAQCARMNAFLLQCATAMSLGGYFCLVADFYLSIRNPFRRPRERMPLYVITTSIVAVGTGIAAATGAAYRADFGLCWVSKHGVLHGSAAGLLLYGWLAPGLLISLALLLHGSRRLQKNKCRDTLQTRKRALTQTQVHACVFSLHWGALGALWALAWSREGSHPGSDSSTYMLRSRGITIAFAVVLGSTGLVDGCAWFILWCLRNRSDEGTDADSRPRGDISEQLRKDFVKTVVRGIGATLGASWRDLPHPDGGSVQGHGGCREMDKQWLRQACAEVLSWNEERVLLHSMRRRGSEDSQPQSDAAPLLDAAASSAGGQLPGQSVFCCCRPEPRFQTFAPRVFACLLRHYKVSQDDWQRTVGDSEAEQAMRTNFSEGKSGEFFFFTAPTRTEGPQGTGARAQSAGVADQGTEAGAAAEGDTDDKRGRFLFKTVSEKEMAKLLSMLPSYVHHMTTSDPPSLLCRFFGAFRISLYGGSKCMVVMNNVVSPPEGMTCSYSEDVYEQYDLKGATAGRNAKPPRPQRKRGTLKDNDFRKPIPVEREFAKRVLNACRADTEFLEQQGIMDYSLLVGVWHGAAPPPCTDAAPVESPEYCPVREIRGPERCQLGIIDILVEWDNWKRLDRLHKLICKGHCFGLPCMGGQRQERLPLASPLDHTELSTVTPLLYAARFRRRVRDVLDYCEVEQPEKREQVTSTRSTERSSSITVAPGC
eukprot:TRINITY_DN70120_c0_g1_i1.p1 TRINITY_DN70120_c0_g1~~TRINITY_DN70120_c0_g1_i1.p1  ORF type:complete len:1031 (+),score=139.61 TRINITY_DN70120_c0_g1_i1:70-3162(+)